MDALAAKLDSKLREWKPETAEEVRALIDEIMSLADTDSLDLMRSRAIEQEVLDLLDEPHRKRPGRSILAGKSARKKAWATPGRYLAEGEASIGLRDRALVAFNER